MPLGVLESAGSPASNAVAFVGPVDRVLIGWQRLLNDVMGRLPRIARLLIAGLVLLLPLVAVVMTRDPLTVALLSLAMVVGVIEVAIIALTRTISVRAMFVAASVGAGLVSFLTVMTVGGLQTVFGVADFDARSVGRALFTPAAEELLKIAPLLLIVAGSRRARTMTIADFGLLGFASGIGFALTEEILRSGTSTNLVGISPLPALLAFPADPGAAWANAPWLVHRTFYSHGMATAIVAIAIGFAWRAYRSGTRRLPWVAFVALVLGYVIALHMHTNVGTSDALWPEVRTLIRVVGQPDLLPWLTALLALAAVVTDVLDLRRTGGSLLGLFLPTPADGATGSFDLLDMRARRLLAARHAYGASRQPLDPWSASALGATGLTGALLLLAIPMLGMFAAQLPGGAACTTCVWEPKAGLSWWALALLSMALDLLPGIGDIKGLFEGISGRNVITGEKLRWWERILGSLPVVGGLLRAAGKAGRGLRAAGWLAEEVAAGYGHLQVVGFAADSLAEAGRMEEAASQAARAAAMQDLPLGDAAGGAGGEAPTWDLGNARARATGLAAQAQAGGYPVIANISGADYANAPPGAINIGTMTDSSAAIPNLVEADGTYVGDLFPPETVDRIVGRNMAPGVVNWNQAAPGAYRVLKPGGTFEYAFQSPHPDLKLLAAALREAKFRFVEVIADTIVRAVK